MRYIVVTFSSQWWGVQTKDTLLFFHKNSHCCMCCNSKYSAEDVCSEDKEERFSSYQPKWTFFFFPLEWNMKVCENHSSPFFYALIELNGTELNFWWQKNALSLPWILNCSAFRIVSYRCSSLNRYDSHIFSRTKFKQISHNEHDKYLSLWLNQKPLLLHPRAFN